MIMAWSGFSDNDATQGIKDPVTRNIVAAKPYVSTKHFFASTKSCAWLHFLTSVFCSTLLMIHFTNGYQPALTSQMLQAQSPMVMISSQLTFSRHTKP